MLGETVTATGWLVIKGDRNRYGRTDETSGLKPIESARLTTLRVNRPSSLDADEIAIKVRLKVPVAVFNPIMPTFDLTVPAELIVSGPIEVEAVSE